ncbi:MAG TPA: hypothetical protein VN822_00280 [Candidatus Acidoferrales bacterium]|nr:hypothetical protein [Candidatus Acidoferrales bacterium]
MADWRQIQARIRKAKNSPDAQAKLSELYQRTRDAMVAWELGAIEEKAEHTGEAGNWYTIAAQRFRRADWKKKAEEALTRLGLPLPLPGILAAEPPATSAEPPALATPESYESHPQLALGEIPMTMEERAAPESSPQATGTAANDEAGRRKRRRGRRGGRGRRRKGGPAQPGLPAQAFAERPATQPPSLDTASALAIERRASDRVEVEPPAPQELRAARVEPPPPQLPSERAAHGRGDPALASRMAHLESMLRRLLGSPLHRLDEAEDAPAGPGVFLLSESDQTESYYVEACQTLRIGLGNLARGARGGKNIRGARGPSDAGLKARLAEHLGINEAKVSQYLKDHCVVRWIQLDDEAPLLAHFAIGVLRTPLNLD